MDYREKYINFLCWLLRFSDDDQSLSLWVCIARKMKLQFLLGLI